MIAVCLKEGVRTEEFVKQLTPYPFLHVTGDTRMSRLYFGAVLVDPVAYDEQSAMTILNELPTVRSTEVIPQEKVDKLPRLIIAPRHPAY